MSRRSRVAIFVAALALIAIAGAYIFVRGHGFSARAEPGRFETVVARAARSLAIPASARNRANPVRWSEDINREGLAHFADHCAMCHGNDGSGDTEMGKGLYPKAPDMRLAATQELTDGELFYVIEGAAHRDARVGHRNRGRRSRELAPGAFHPSPAETHGRRTRAHGGAQSDQRGRVAAADGGAGVFREHRCKTCPAQATGPQTLTLTPKTRFTMAKDPPERRPFTTGFMLLT